jgi:hypothetical protein
MLSMTLTTLLASVLMTGTIFALTTSPTWGHRQACENHPKVDQVEEVAVDRLALMTALKVWSGYEALISRAMWIYLPPGIDTEIHWCLHSLSFLAVPNASLRLPTTLQEV